MMDYAIQATRDGMRLRNDAEKTTAYCKGFVGGWSCDVLTHPHSVSGRYWHAYLMGMIDGATERALCTPDEESS